MALVKSSVILLALVLTTSIFTFSEGSRITPFRNVASFWCVAIDGRPNLAADIDNLCKSGAVDCMPIRPGGRCYNPNNDNFHASYVFNAYYQARKTPDACNFNGDAMLEANQDLSTPTCHFPR